MRYTDARPTLPSGTQLLAAATVALSACASSRTATPTGDVSVTPSSVRIESGTGGAGIDMNLMNENRADLRIVKATVDQVWAVLPGVFADLGVPVNLYVDRSHQIGAKSARFRGKVGTRRMSTLISCGSDISGEEKSNLYEVTLDVMTSVAPGAIGGQANLMTLVTATARPMATSGDPVRCASTGGLERQIATLATIKAAVH